MTRRLQQVFQAAATAPQQPLADRDRAHRRREGLCVCRLSLQSHWDAFNRFLGCVGAAERELAAGEGSR